MGYHFDKSLKLDLTTFIGVFFNGLKLDIAFASYLAIVPGLIITLGNFRPSTKIAQSLKLYNTVVLLLTSFIIVADLELYKAWGFRIDGTTFKYLSAPTEMIASVWSSPLFLLIAFWMLTYFAFKYLFNQYLVNKYLNNIQKSYLQGSLMLFFTAALIIPSRGGLQQIPINASAVYFSKEFFANDAAVNPCWNLCYAITEKNYQTVNPFVKLPEKEAINLFNGLYQVDTSKHFSVLNTPKPNVLLIIVESFSSKFIGVQNGLKDVTPNVDALTKEGIFFNNCYASGDRSDKGMTAILSGYPSQPTTSIIFDNKKAAHLPNLGKELLQAGYATAYYYGGEMEFANLKSYILSGGFQNNVSKVDFDEKFYNSKWGVHDHVVFDRLFNDLNKTKAPFFDAIFTLSNHEPFEIPIVAPFKGNDIETLFKNSAWYTDKSIGEFIAKAKKTSWWKNTLVIITADHGHRMPGDSPNHDKEKFHIPMLWLGGALAMQDTVMTQLCSQTDLAKSLLNQLQLKSDAYRFSNDVFNTSTKPFAYYSFNNGFGFLSPAATIYFDNKGNLPINSEEIKKHPKELSTGQAYLQELFQDYLNK
jgi:phosphoglycerol transferase MdoB-like AlkP superfamily enzyme